MGLQAVCDIDTPMLEVAVVVLYQTALYHMPGKLFQMMNCQLFPLLTAHLHIFLLLKRTHQRDTRTFGPFAMSGIFV